MTWADKYINAAGEEELDRIGEQVFQPLRLAEGQEDETSPSSTSLTRTTRTSPSETRSSSSTNGTSTRTTRAVLAEVRRLLQEVDSGQLTVEPLAISLPSEAPGEVRAVFDAYLVVREVFRMVDTDTEEIPFSYGFAAERCGLERDDAREAIRWLLTEGYLVKGESLPPTTHQHGTKTYRLGNRR
jgi:hypothetical protein